MRILVRQDPAVAVVPFSAGIRVEKEIGVPMNDGVRLHANVFRPESDAPVPVLVALIPYGKATPPQHAFVEQEQAFDDVGLSFGAVTISENTPFEAPDPGYWVPRGGESLRVVVRGTDTFSTAYHPHTQLVNHGAHTIYTGGTYDSHLLLPIVR